MPLRRARLATLVTLVLLVGTARPSLAQPEGFPDLVAGLRAIEGNLGVETAQTATGKQVIFAWFEDKEAVLRWYHSDMHRDVHDMFFPARPEHEPLAHIPDDQGPILAIASITPSIDETVPPRLYVSAPSAPARAAWIAAAATSSAC